MMKKALTLVLAGVTALSLTACGGRRVRVRNHSSTGRRRRD